MSHYFESGVVANTQAWHGLATVHNEQVDGALTPQKALELSGLDWEVRKEEVFYGDQRVPEKYFTVRSSDDKVLGIVGKNYQVVQNYEGFDMLGDLVDSGEIEIETAISIKGGSTVAIVARRPESITIAGEEVIPYINFCNGHDGKSQLQMFTGDTRVVCSNTLNLGLRTAKTSFKIRHTRNVRNRIQEARDALQVSFKYSDELQRLGDEMVGLSFSNKEFDDFLQSLIPLPDEKGRGRTRRENMQEEIRDIYFEADNLNNIRGSRWGVLNAVVEYGEHHRRYKDEESRFLNTLQGIDINQEALALLS